MTAADTASDCGAGCDNCVRVDAIRVESRRLGRLRRRAAKVSPMRSFWAGVLLGIVAALLVTGTAPPVLAVGAALALATYAAVLAVGVLRGSSR